MSTCGNCGGPTHASDICETCELEARGAEPDAVTKLLDEADALAAKATKGPWVAIRSHSYCSPHVRSASLESAVLYGRSWTSARDGIDDVEFAANARDLVPKLSAMVRDLMRFLANAQDDAHLYEIGELSATEATDSILSEAADTLRRVEAIAKGEVP